MSRFVTLADEVLRLSVQRWWLAPMDKPTLPFVAAYGERLMQRPGFRTCRPNGDP